MNKSELVAAVSAHTEVEKKHVVAVLDGLEDVIVGTVHKGEKVALTGAFVHASPGDALGLEASMRHRDVAVVVAVPDVDGGRDVLEAKPPLTRKEGEVLCGRPRCRRGSTSVRIDVCRSHLGAAHHLDIRLWELTQARSY